jgi:hypothetical protein
MGEIRLAALFAARAGTRSGWGPRVGAGGAAALNAEGPDPQTGAQTPASNAAAYGALARGSLPAIVAAEERSRRGDANETGACLTVALARVPDVAAAMARAAPLSPSC